MPDPTLQKLIVRLHGLIPSASKLRWIDRMQQFIRVCGDSGSLSIGSGCTGTDVWAFGWKWLLRYWHDEFLVDATRVTTCLAADICADRRTFLDQHHEIGVLVDNVASYDEPVVQDTRTHKVAPVPGVEVFGGGCSCKPLGRLNKSRSSMQGCVRDGTLSSGETFEGLRRYVQRFRPRYFYFENVPEIGFQKKAATDEAPVPESDKEYVIRCFEGDLKYTVWYVVIDATEHGSPKALRRAWFLGIDCPRWISEQLGVEAAFWEVFSCFRIDPYNVEDFFMSPEQIDAFVSASTSMFPDLKRTKCLLDWKSTHEELFSEFDIIWPPVHEPIPDFNDREDELVWLANKVFPPTEPGWTYFDANHSAEWILPMKPLTQSRSNTWKALLPTMIGKGAIACRKADEYLDVAVLKRLHPLEAFRMNLWELEFWKVSPSVDTKKKYLLLNEMAGNMWSLFHFIPLAMSLSGAVPWLAVEELRLKEKNRRAANPDPDRKWNDSETDYE